MLLKDLKGQLHSLIEETNNEALLEDLLLKAQARILAKEPHEAEGLYKDDYDELISLVKEPPLKDTVSYGQLKDSLSRWFIK